MACRLVASSSNVASGLAPRAPQWIWISDFTGSISINGSVICLMDMDLLMDTDGYTYPIEVKMLRYLISIVIFGNSAIPISLKKKTLAMKYYIHALFDIPRLASESPSLCHLQ